MREENYYQFVPYHLYSCSLRIEEVSLITHNCTLMCGNVIKYEIINQIIKDCIEFNYYVYPFVNEPRYCEIRFQIDELIKELSWLIETIKKRLEFIENFDFDRQYVNSSSEEERKFIRPMILIIDKWMDYIESNNYKCIDILQHQIRWIMEYAEKAHLYLIISTTKVDGYINSNIYNLFDTIIYLDNNHTVTDIKTVFNVEEQLDGKYYKQERTTKLRQIEELQITEEMEKKYFHMKPKTIETDPTKEENPLLTKLCRCCITE